MKKLFVFISLLLLVFGTASLQAQDAPEQIREQLDMILEMLRSDELSPAATLLVITPDWTYENAIGVTEVGGDVPVTIDMQFQIGSNTKMMTSAIILQLQEEGLLDIDDLLSKYLPDIASRLPYGDEITLRQMLKMRSGIWDYVDPLLEANFAAGNIEQEYSYQELIDYTIENGTAEFAPDSLDENGEPNFSYSNTGYLLLGMIIEELTGQALSKVYAERIFEPLGMENTYFEAGIVPEGATPHGYIPNEDGELVDTTDLNMSAANSAGAVISTSHDMATFISALLHGDLYQDPASLDLMLSDPKINSSVGGNYALGIRDETNDNDWGHGGTTLAFYSDVVYNLNSGITVISWATSGAQSGIRYVNQLVMRVIEGVETNLVDLPFYLTEIINDDEVKELSPEQSANYFFSFNDDGTISVKADCNQATMSYTLAVGGTLYTASGFIIEPGSMTRAACAPDSLSDVFLSTLESSISLSTIDDGMGNGGLILIVQTELGNLFFKSQISSD